MESLGNLAGGLAHNLNNILVPILSLSQRLTQMLPENGRERRAAEMINLAGTNTKDLVKGIPAKKGGLRDAELL